MRNCMMQKGRARLGEAAAPPGHRLLGGGATHRQPHGVPEKAVRKPCVQARVGLFPTTDRELSGDSQLCPLPRQPGVWTRPADPLTHRAASAPPTMGARNVPGAARRGGATWWPDRVCGRSAGRGDVQGRRRGEEAWNLGDSCHLYIHSILHTQHVFKNILMQCIFFNLNVY